MKKKIILIVIIVVCIMSSLILWSRFVSTKGLIIKEYIVKSSEIPQSFDGLKLIHFSDLHYGTTVFEKELKDLVKKINYVKPDIVVFTGDLIDKHFKTNDNDYNILIKHLSEINARIEKYAVVGNHDYKNEKYVEIMEKSGFVMLNNSYDLIYNGDFKPIFIGGIGNVSYKKHDLDTTFSYFNDKVNNLYKIILVHEPDIIDKLDKYDVNLVLSGHSHNGQINLPLIGAIYTPKYAKKYYASYYKVNKTDLYISSGIGCSEINFRFLNKPSINFYRFDKIKEK